MAEKFRGIMNEEEAAFIQPALGQNIILKDDKGVVVVAITLGARGPSRSYHPVRVNLEFPRGFIPRVVSRSKEQIGLQGDFIKSVFKKRLSK